MCDLGLKQCWIVGIDEQDRPRAGDRTRERMARSIGGNDAVLHRAADSGRRSIVPLRDKRHEEGGIGRRLPGRDAADDAGEMRQVRPHPGAFQTRLVDQPLVGWALQHVDGSKIIEGEEAGLVAVIGLVPPGGEDARHGQALGHVLDAMPRLIGLDVAGCDTVPERQEGRACKVHERMASVCGSIMTLTPDRSRMAAKPRETSAKGSRWVISLR